MTRLPPRDDILRVRHTSGASDADFQPRRSHGTTRRGVEPGPEGET